MEKYDGNICLGVLGRLNIHKKYQKYVVNAYESMMETPVWTFRIG